jgi:nicotinamide-nucleotide adenylyltransferase
MPNVMVHGRFQPFHNEHLAYVREGLDRASGYLVVGITNPFPASHPEGGFSGDDHRHDPDANPYTFLQRARMVQLSLAAEGVDLSTVLVIPLDLDRLDRCSAFAAEVEQLVNVQEEWDEEKCVRFADAGFSVIRFHRRRTMSGSQVREMIERRESVDHLLPCGTLAVLEHEA